LFFHDFRSEDRVRRVSLAADRDQIVQIFAGRKVA
jgi:hypothetical protein